MELRDILLSSIVVTRLLCVSSLLLSTDRLLRINSLIRSLISRQDDLVSLTHDRSGINRPSGGKDEVYGLLACDAV
jgi:hypothetical protein